VGHGRDIKRLADDVLQLREPSALPERSAALHCAEQRVIKALDGIGPARGHCIEGLGKNGQGQYHGKACGFARWYSQHDRLVYDSISSAAGAGNPSAIVIAVSVLLMRMAKLALIQFHRMAGSALTWVNPAARRRFLARSSAAAFLTRI
jgi:hypothetical protein